MNWQGWMFMLIAWTFIGGFFFYSFKRILFSDKSYPEKDKNQNQKGRY